MTVPYLARLACLSLACYFLLHTALAAMVWAVSGRVVRAAGRLRPRDAARVLLGLRLLPAAAALLAVAAVCVPSFLWLEPEETAEAAGGVCLVAALLGASLWITAAWRGARAAVQSRRYVRACDRSARPERAAGGLTVWVVDTAAPVLALAGLAPPRVVISRSVMNALSPEQLEAALAHETAHQRSRDNFKRLALLLAPEILPGARIFGALERAWARTAEWAADEGAVSGDAHRRLALADALVRTVRLGCAGRPAGPLATTLMEDPVELQARVARLLETPAERCAGARFWMVAALTGMALALLAAQPGTLYSVHWLLEGLMR